MSKWKMVVVVPGGPNDDVADTLRSVLHYADPELIVVIDDTQGRGIGLKHPKLVEILPAASTHRDLGGLWVNLSKAFRYAVENTEFDLLLRLDADALLLGPGIAEAAGERFQRFPEIGALGAYRISPDGGLRDWASARRALLIELWLRGIRYPSMRRQLRKLMAASPEYIRGEHALGGAVLYRGDAVREMYRRRLLDSPEFAHSILGEDFIFGLITVAAGYRTADFSGPEDPLALRWKGLPAAPQELLAKGKLVTHSVRFWADMPEAEIREYFAAARADATVL
jgi:hypothetical protein